jgi:proteasome lid subunit RPN8/RPN11
VKRVRLAAGVAEGLRAASDAARPREACGLLAGTRSRGEVRVARALPARNLARAADAFVVDPGDLVAADDAARADGLELVGAWHSHPGGGPEPSRADLDGAWPGSIALIVGAQRVAAWTIEGGRAVELPVAGPEGAGR